MKLSLKWFRKPARITAAAVTLLLFFHGNADAAFEDVSPDIGLQFEFTAANPAAMTPATVEIKASSATSLAGRLGIPTTDSPLKNLEGVIDPNATTDANIKALISHAASDGVIQFTLENGRRYSIPTKAGAEKVGTNYGIAFETKAGAAGGATISNVSGVAAQSRLRINDDVTQIDRTPPANALHAYALFFNAIQANGRATLTVGGKDYQVPQSPIVTGVGRGVSGTGPHVPFPQFLDRGNDPVEDSDDRSSSNEVITARVETYYFRDAHRLAQILNRGVKSYQAAAVSLLERAAQDAGDTFEVAKSRRRELEFNAAEKARELRQRKKELASVAAGLRQQLNPGLNSGPNGPTTLSDYHKSLDDLIKRRTSTTLEMQDVQNRKIALQDEIRRIKAEQASKPQNVQLKADLSTAEQRLATANSQITDLGKQIAFLDNQISTLSTLIKSFVPPQPSTPATAPPTLDTLNELVADVQRLEVEVSEATLKAQQANDAEQLAAKNKFRAEVSAAKADPDTYVPGKLNSVDPVTQVSISVIGEGVLHLRGPRLGVVKIREMIHQLDHPVGQVKLGIMTVQLNGENGARMENTMRRMEGHLSRGRFLTYVSQELFKRAVAEVSARVAAQTPKEVNIEDYRLSPGSIGFAQKQAAGIEKLFGTGRPGLADAGRFTDNLTIDQLHRWNIYATAFFGADFLAGLRDVNPESPTLNPLNKLLSLSSADSLTITEALFVTALAKGTVRQQILKRFRYYLQTDLPEKDFHWITVNRIKKGWNPLWWGEDCTKKEFIVEHAQKFYTFDATSTFLDREYADDDPFCCDGRVLDQYGQIVAGGDGGAMNEMTKDTLNPFQREVIRLTQGLSMQFWLQQRRTNLVNQRELVRRSGAGSTLTQAEQFLVNSEIDRLTEQHLGAMETVRGRKAALDKLIKQVVIAMEDDVYAQFYNPALERIRRAASEWDVELGEVERTTILTNNRAFGKVSPQASYQFDLPKRDILLAEAMKSAYALHKDLGPLVGDPNFGTLTKMFAGQSISGSTVDGTIKSVLPGLSTSQDQKNLLFADSTEPQKFGTELEKLVPDPAIYKFETGTGYEVRPVVQPDGQSVVFDFDYMYTTDLLEPTNPDERSLGRVKRHFVDTEVQLGNLEWREISRYEVSLKAARNGRGVPLLEDIPVLGIAFRPLPQAKKSIQKNIIVGQAAIYPTVEDLLGLKSPSAAGLDVYGMGEGLADTYQQAKARSAQVDQILSNKTGWLPLTITGTNASGPTGTQNGMIRRDKSGPQSIPLFPAPTAADRTGRIPTTHQYQSGKSVIEQTGYRKPVSSAPANATPSRRRIEQ